jgi:hypothetical protein
LASASRAAFSAASCIVLALSAGCAGQGQRLADPLAYAAANLPKSYPACEKEIGAFLRTLTLARQAGEDWEIFEPALEEMEDQMLDCVADSYPDPIPI